MGEPGARHVNALLEKLRRGDRDKLRQRGMRRRIVPMWATLTEDYFPDDDWIFERKFDGERCLAFRDGRGIRLWSRNHQRLDDTYPELVDSLNVPGHARFVVDGEVVAFEGKRTSFARLQDRMRISDARQARRSGVRVYFYLFDLLYLNGQDLTALPLRVRKQVLRELHDYGGPLRFTNHRNGSGEAYHRDACRKGWEGVIAKRADSAYAQRRSRDWLKFKCVRRQELVVGGYTDPRGRRCSFGALLVGSYAVELSNESKVLFPEARLTKGDLIAYYRDVAPVMVPHLANRPLTLQRFPDGIDGDGFFLDWSELDRSDLDPRGWTLRNAFRRLGQKGDPWAGVARAATSIDAAREKLDARLAEGD